MTSVHATCQNCGVFTIPPTQQVSQNIYVNLEEWKGKIYLDACHGQDYEVVWGKWDHKEYGEAMIICKDGKMYRVFIK